MKAREAHYCAHAQSCSTVSCASVVEAVTVVVQLLCGVMCDALSAHLIDDKCADMHSREE